MSSNYIVKRSNSLIESRFNLSASQNNIIDLVLHKLKSDDTNLAYEINILDYVNLFNKGSNHVYADLKKSAKEFIKSNAGFTLYDYKGFKEMDFFWFCNIRYLENEGKIIFKLDPEVKEIMLQIKNVTYYDIKYTLNFTSVYSKRMYLYLKRFENTRLRIDKVSDLLEKLNCPTSYYNRYNAFKLKVLDIAFKEINNNTDINFTYEEKKTGRKITHLIFCIKTVYEERSEKQITDNKEYVKNPSEKDISVLLEELDMVIEEPIKLKDLKNILKVANNDLSLIKEKYKLAKKQGNIENLVGWLTRAIKNNYTVLAPIEVKKVPSNKPYIKPNRFINYEQREWDFEELKKLERELLDKEFQESNI